MATIDLYVVPMQLNWSYYLAMWKEYIYDRLRQVFFCLNKTRKIWKKDYDFVTWITENVPKTKTKRILYF